jgi:hypothetical protein
MLQLFLVPISLNNRYIYLKTVGISCSSAVNFVCSPVKMIEHVKEEFLKVGGLVIEGSGLSKVNVYDDAAVFSSALHLLRRN